jgi:parallel beta-helix repeat protein
MKKSLILIILFAFWQAALSQTLVSGSITQNTTWALSNSPYLITGTVTVQNGVTLTINPGVVVKSEVSLLNVTMKVKGTLLAQGTQGQPIIFTSKKDDEYGGDSNNDGNATVPNVEDWTNILIESSGGSSILDHCIFRYGGFELSSGVESVLDIDGSNPVVQNCIFFKNGRGIDVTKNGNPLLSSNSFDYCISAPVAKNLSSTVSFQNNIFLPTNGINAIGLLNNATNNAGDTYTLQKSNVGTISNIPYSPVSTITIAVGNTLIIEPGVIIKSIVSMLDEAFIVKGTLLAEGNPSEPIIFTSKKDDEYGGDNNNDGKFTSPNSGDWTSLLIESTGGQSKFENCQFRYGGFITQANANDAVLNIDGSNPSVNNCVFFKNKRGIDLTGSNNMIVRNCLFEQNTHQGLSNQSSSGSQKVDSCSFVKNVKGIVNQTNSIILKACKFDKNTTYHIENLSTNDIDASGNWWGIDYFLQMATSSDINFPLIYDKLDNTTKGRIIYFPTLPPYKAIFKVTPPAYVISNISLEMELLAYKMTNFSSVFLQKGDKIIPSINNSFIDTLNIKSTFNFEEEEPGIYDIKIVGNNNDTIIAIAGFSLLDLPTIPFDEWVPFEVTHGTSFAAAVNIPNDDKVFALVKKSNRIGYSSTWTGGIGVSPIFGTYAEENDGDYAFMGRGGDIDMEINNEQQGSYFFEIKTKDEVGKGYVKFTNTPDKLTAGQWTTGEILRPYGFDWKYIDVPANTSSLSIRTEGFGRWSSVHVFYESIKVGSPSWVFRNWGMGYNIEGSIPNPLPGRYYIRYMDSAVMLTTSSNPYDEQNQTRDYLIVAGFQSLPPSPSLPLQITGLSNDSVGQGNVTFEIFGYGFNVNDSIYLQRTGFSNIGVSSKKFAQLKDKWEVSFELSSVEAGEWEVKVFNGNMTVSSPQKLTILSTEEPNIEFNLIASTTVRAGRWRPIIVEITNTGNVDAFFVPFFLKFKGNIQIEDSLKIIRTHEILDTLFDSSQLVNTDGWMSWDEIKPFFSITDTITGSKLTYLPLYFPQIKPGETKRFECKIKYLAQGNFDIELFSLQSFFNNDEIAFKGSQSCSEAIANATIEIIKNYSDVLFPDWEACENAMAQGVIIIGKGATQYGGSNVPPGDMMDILVDMFSSTLGCVSSFMPQSKLLKAMADLLDILGKSKAIYEPYEDIKNNCEGDKSKKPKKHSGQSVNSMTPEDKYGKVGAEQSDGLALSERKNFITKQNKFSYRIDYWNSDTATAPAAEVFIRDTLDGNFDLTTFDFAEIGFLRWRVPLDGGHHFNVNIDMRPDYNYIVNVDGTLNPYTREVYWIHRTLDPVTLELPDDPLSGYLPPIDPEGYFIGWVKFDVSPKVGLPTGTTFENQARVNFDGIGPWGPAPPYGPYRNTYDLDAPTSFIGSLPSQISDTSFVITWNGNDGNGSGVSTYDIYVSQNGLSFSPWIVNTTQTEAIFVGKADSSYCFYSIASDKVGNVEGVPTQPDACKQITVNVSEPSNYGYKLLQNIPNPFKDETVIGFILPETSDVKLIVTNQIGQTRTILDGNFNSGLHQVSFRPNEENGSVSFYTIVTPKYIKTLKMVNSK